MMEIGFDAMQIALALAGATATTLAAFGAGLRLAIGQSEKALNGERAARQVLERELRADIKTASATNQRLQFRIQSLEQSKNRLESELDENRRLLATMRIETEALQKWREKAQQWIEDKDATIRGQSLEIKRLERELQQTDARNSELEIENRTLRQALTLIGAERIAAQPKGDGTDGADHAARTDADGTDAPPVTADTAPNGGGEGKANDG